MSTPKTTAIFVTYLSQDTVDSALEAAKHSHLRGLLNAIVVDNASTDGTVEFVAREHPWVKLIANRENVGYGRGLNTGLPHVDTPYVLLMNPDAVLDAGNLEVLVRFLDEHPEAGIVAPAIRRAAGNYQHAGELPTPRSMILDAMGIKGALSWRVPIVPGSPPFAAEWLCGACLLARTDLLRKLNGFDPRFFLYFEETDLCLRARLAGAELWAVGEAVAHHASNSSARRVCPDLPDGGCLVEHLYPSRFYYLVKHHGWIAASSVELIDLAARAFRDFARLLTGRRSRGELRLRLQSSLFRCPAKPA
ncbi:MAG: glycosyltransferase family 2 protein [Phycisphaerae bacterium]|nr:glycosyltransferase family 2 protein [Phycisphaerae bacterium]